MMARDTRGGWCTIRISRLPSRRAKSAGLNAVDAQPCTSRSTAPAEALQGSFIASWELAGQPLIHNRPSARTDPNPTSRAFGKSSIIGLTDQERRPLLPDEVAGVMLAFPRRAPSGPRHRRGAGTPPHSPCALHSAPPSRATEGVGNALE